MWIALGILFDGAAALSVLTLSGSASLVLAWFMHIIASLAFTRALTPHLTERYQVFRRQVTVFLWVLQSLLPVVGTVGCGLAFCLAARPRTISVERTFRTVELPDLPFQPPMETGKPHYSEGGLSLILQDATQLDKRVEAIIATKQMKKQLALPLLKAALRDPADDVRLLAYALLDMAEKEMSEKLKVSQRRWESAQDEDRYALGVTLAWQYWDAVFLGLVTGSNRSAMLQKAYRLLTGLVRERPSGAALHLLGRVSLALQLPAKAALRFRQAIDAGGSEAKNLPYLAEALFELKQYHRLPRILARLSTAGGYTGKHEALIQFWKGRETNAEEGHHISWLEEGGVRGY
jgi:tetratricopeptide (TPR) repeat protein